MYEALWNGLFDTRWEDAPLGPEAIRLALWLRKRGYSDRSYRDYAHAVVHLGRVLHERHGEVTAGVLDSLREERPPSHHRGVFLSRRPPAGSLRSKINRRLGRCFDKAGIEVPGAAHRLFAFWDSPYRKPMALPALTKAARQGIPETWSRSSAVPSKGDRLRSTHSGPPSHPPRRFLCGRGVRP